MVIMNQKEKNMRTDTSEGGNYFSYAQLYIALAVQAHHASNGSLV